MEPLKILQDIFCNFKIDTISTQDIDDTEERRKGFLVLGAKISRCWASAGTLKRLFSLREVYPRPRFSIF